MKILLALHLTTGDRKMPFDGHDRFLALARQQGLEVRGIRVEKPAGAVDMDDILRQISAAQGFWIRHPGLLENKLIRQAVEARLSDGAVAIAQLHWEERPGSDWFQDMGLEATSIRAVRSDSLALDRFTHPMLVPVDRETYDYGFRDASLFRGVRQLVLQQANGIGCFGDAQVVLAIPSSSVRLLDTRTDYLVSILRPELPVAATSSRPDWRGRVIAFHAGFFGDPYQGALGDEFPCIGAADNEQLARNLVQLVSGGFPPVGTSWEDAYALIADIETGVARLTERVLRARSGTDWFTLCVPAQVQDKCRRRSSEEDAGFPVAAYVDLIDYKTIWKENWSIFGPLLDSHAPPASKTRSLHFFQDVNRLRILAAHPTKRLLGGLPAPTGQEMDLLRRHKETVARLIELP